MLFAKSSLLKSSVSAVALASLLIVGGCNRGDKGQGALKSNEISALNLNKADSKIFSQYFEVEACAADEMESLGALAGLGIGESGDSGVTYARRDIDGSKVTYTNLEIQDEDNETDLFAAETATFYCASMKDDGPVFDRLDLKNAKIQSDQAKINFETLNVSQPTASAAASLVEGMLDPVGNTQTGDVGFGGISLTGATMSGEGFEGKLEALAWGEKPDDSSQSLANMMIDKLFFTFTNPDNENKTQLNFDGMSARNIAMGKLDASSVSTTGMFGSVFEGLTLHKKPYDEFHVGEFIVDNPNFNIDFKGVEAKATEKGDVITIKQSLKPLTIKLSPEMRKDPLIGQNYDYLEALGFETMSFSGSSVSVLDKAKDSISVTDGLLVMEDAFRMNFEYSAIGLNEMVDTLKNMTDLELRQEPMKAYDSLKLKSLRYTLEDNSITERGLRLASKMTGQSEKAIKGMLGVAVLGAGLAAENDLQAEIYTEAGSAFADFVKDGGTLTFEINPPEPFPLTSLLSNGGEDVDPAALGFSAIQENADAE